MNIFKRIKSWIYGKYYIICAEIIARREGYKNFDELWADLESMPDVMTQEESDELWNRVVAQLKAEGIWKEDDEQDSQG